MGIDFIDTGDAFLEHYNKYHELPYGFANTTPGNGHLNEVGHKIMDKKVKQERTEPDHHRKIIIKGITVYPR